MINRKGCIPAPPVADVPRQHFQYKPGQIESVLARHGQVRCTQYVHGVGKNGTAPIMRLFRHRLMRDSWHEDLVARIELCVSEEVANAMLHGAVGTRFSMVAITLGQHPHRILIVHMDNYLNQDRPTILPNPTETIDFATRLYDHHGRGTGICHELADGYEKILIGNYQVVTVLQFNET